MISETDSPCLYGTINEGDSLKGTLYDNENLTGSIEQKSLSGSLNGENTLNGKLYGDGNLIGQITQSFLRGLSIQYVWDGTKLGIKTEDQTEYAFVNLEGADGLSVSSVEISDNELLVYMSDGTSINAGSITSYDDTSVKKDIQNIKSQLDERKPISNMTIASILQL